MEIKDTNSTLHKQTEQLPAFIDKYTGSDLKQIVQKEADILMMKMVK